jgi:hypothetical protein
MTAEQHEIERLKREVERLQGLLDQRTTAPVPTNPDAASLLTNLDFIVDMSRFSEGLYTEQQVKKKWRFDQSTWDLLGSDDTLVEKIEAEKTRRVRDGSSKREKAQQLVVQGPEVLGKIMNDGTASAKHQIDAIKTLDALAANGPQATPELEHFSIVINLGADERLVFNKSIAVTPHDNPPILDNTDLAKIAQREEEGSGPV